MKIIILLSIFIASYAYSSDTIRVLMLQQDEVIPDLEDFRPLGVLNGGIVVNNNRFSGKMEVWASHKRIYLINVLSLEDYIMGVVMSEVRSDWPLEVLKAQAVVARTYAVYKMNEKLNAPFHIVTNTLNQVYSYARYPDNIIKAVSETRGEILTYNDRPIEAFYHSASEGFTEDSLEVFGVSYPYIKPVRVTSKQSPYSKWKRILTIEEMENKTGIKGIKNISIKSYTSTGRVKRIELITGEGVRVLEATLLRSLLGWQRLPSTRFTVERNGDYIIFTGSGYGHGVGLSQWSALDMAMNGMSYREILEYFYPGTILKRYEYQ